MKKGQGKGKQAGVFDQYCALTKDEAREYCAKCTYSRAGGTRCYYLNITQNYEWSDLTTSPFQRLKYTGNCEVLEAYNEGISLR